jgi:hypothetical protein
MPAMVSPPAAVIAALACLLRVRRARRDTVSRTFGLKGDARLTGQDGRWSRAGRLVAWPRLACCPRRAGAAEEGAADAADQ